MKDNLDNLHEDTHMADRPPYAGTPRWVKAFGVIVVVAILLFVVVLLFGGGRHGPGRHALSGGAGGQVPPSGVMGAYAPPPEGGRE